MGFGRLSETQKEAIRAVVARQTVYDLGAGDLELSKELLALGADGVVAIDQIYNYNWKIYKNPSERIRLVGTCFRDVKVERRAVGFCSWPSNRHMEGFIELAMACDVFIYLGSNVGGNQCSTKPFFEKQLQRTLLAYVPQRQNSLIITSSVPCVRAPTGEERAGLSTDDGDSAIMEFDQAEAT